MRFSTMAALLLLAGPQGASSFFDPHGNGISTIGLILYLIYAVVVGALFLIIHACNRYYRRTFDTSRYFWQAWATATLSYAILGTCFWALAFCTEHVAAG